MEREFGINAGFVQDQFDQYLQNPASVHESWRAYFDALTGKTPRTPANGAARAARAEASSAALAGIVSELSTSVELARIERLIAAYRERGHLAAHFNPLLPATPLPHELSLAAFGLGEHDGGHPLPPLDVGGRAPASLSELVERLRATYCGSVGVEVMHVERDDVRRWLLERMEATENRPEPTPEEQRRILEKLTDAEVFEQFIQARFEKGTKRFSLEGAESLIPLLDTLIEHAGALGMEEIVVGMAHRGRLNVLANIADKDPREIFAAFLDEDAKRHLGSGDVKYHLGCSTDRVTASGQRVHFTLAFNPSHLEWVDPVVEGRVRSKQDRKEDGVRRRVLPLLVHGDAAFIGQGVVAETLNLAELPGYRTGGTVHVLINNQIGYTTLPEHARSTRYASDAIKLLGAPVFHVNGDDPEAVAHVTRLALEARQRFGVDVVIDLYCYRRHGHNEGDEPRFTQPRMYAVIDAMPTVRTTYAARLQRIGTLREREAEAIAAERRATLDAALDKAKRHEFQWTFNAMGGLWTAYRGGTEALVPEVPTAVDGARLTELMRRVTRLPEGFRPHRKVAEILERRLRWVETGQPIDWGTAETLAYASLLAAGVPIRLSGQDTRRGTFAHRHAVLFDVETGDEHAPLAHLGDGAAPFEAWDSPLSEAAVLGFEYGYSLDHPDALVVWEAQFGDFLNSAQVIVDQFISSGEDKWHRLSGLVLLLPHGYEGQGPEHSSARLERFLQLCAEDNMQVCNLTTPAQLFHALRRQVLRPWRKPLVVLSPKSLLRERKSTLADLAQGSFQRVIPDPEVDPSQVTRVLLCSGKVYYDLYQARAQRGTRDVALLRLEQLYPLSDALLRALLPYRDGTKLVWVQEEPWNMGAWYYLRARLPELIGDRLPLSCAARAESASPATGSRASHLLEQAMLMEAAFAV